MDKLSEYLLGGVGATTSPLPPTTQGGALPPPPQGVGMSDYDKDARNLSELSMWQTWKSSGYREKHLTPLMNSLEPAIKYHVNKWKAANVPEDLIAIRAKQITVSALKKYEPVQGYQGRVASPGSWVQNQLQQLQRFVVENQNAGRVQESRAGKHKRVFDEAYQQMRNQLGRDPSIKELAEHMTLAVGKPVTQKQARLFIREQRRDRTVSDENFTYTPTDTRVLIKLLPEELTPLENQVFERMFGLNGCRKMRPGEIAASLKIDNSRVSRLKNKINAKASEYL
jgi:hypothetical protein